MPRVVDHEARRRELAEALWQVLVREGLLGTTIRSVAAEAGVTRGTVEHYFANKDELVRYACRMATDRALAAIKATRARLSGRDALRAVLLNDLKLRTQSRASMGMWLGLLSAASRDPELATVFVRLDGEMRAMTAEIIAEMITRGEASVDVDPEAEARALLAFHLALVLDVGMRPELCPDEVVAKEVEALLDRLSNGKPRR